MRLMRYHAHGFAESATMPHDHEHRESRQQEILALLDSHRVRSQGELVELLRERGIAVTQSSVSRDLRDLGVAWMGGRYARLAEHDERDPGVAEVSHFLRGVKPSGPYLTVLFTMAGAAQAVGIAMDRAGWPALVGTKAGAGPAL